MCVGIRTGESSSTSALRTAKISLGMNYDSSQMFLWPDVQYLCRYEQMAREHDAQFPFIKEELINALDANVCRSYRALSIVRPPFGSTMRFPSIFVTLRPPFSHPQAHQRLVQPRHHRGLA